MACLPTHLSSTCDSVKNNSLLNYHVEGPFVRVGNTNRDKRVLLFGLVLPIGIKGLDILSRVEPPTGTKGGLLSRLVAPPGTKGPCPPSAPLDPGQKPPFVPGSKVTGTNDLKQRPILFCSSGSRPGRRLRQSVVSIARPAKTNTPRASATEPGRATRVKHPGRAALSAYGLSPRCSGVGGALTAPVTFLSFPFHPSGASARGMERDERSARVRWDVNLSIMVSR